METSNQFQLELAIDGYLQQLQSGGNFTSDDIQELKAHLQDNIADLKQRQLDDEEAFIVARKRLGRDEDLHVEFKKVNGNIFYNRDLFVMVMGICTYLLFTFLYSIVQNGLKYFAIYGDQNAVGLGIVNYFFQFVIVTSFIYIVFNSKKFLAKISRLFSGSPANFSALVITLLVILYFLDFYLQRTGGNHLEGKTITERYFQFTINNTIFNFVRLILGSIVLIAFFAAFVTSYKKVNILDSIVNKAGYIALFCFGIFWDGLAASARMLHGFTKSEFLVPAIAFGAIWFIGMLIFNLYLKRNIFYRNAVFLLFGFVMEFAAGMWLNPGLRYGLPVSVFFIALVIGGGLGFLTSKLIKRKAVLKPA